MKKGYIPKDQRKKILLLGDDLRTPSGVGTQSRNLVLSTCHYYNWVQIAGAMKHPDKGKRFDLSPSIKEDTGVEDPSVMIYPSDGYGDHIILRQMLNIEKPDAVMFFTDPRYYIWLFKMEHEIRQKIPMIYYNIWDDTPYPFWNRPYYRSCDQLLCISKQTKNLVENVLRDYPKEDWQTKYLPHGISPEHFFPIEEKKHPQDFHELKKLKKDMFGEDEPEFVVFFNSRNIRRKNIPDIILAWRMFTDFLPKEKAKRCKLILHTQVSDANGTDLAAVINSICDPEQNPVVINGNHVTHQRLNQFCNLSDCHMFMTDNEGWGLGLTESLMVGRMIIAPVQGGMQDQMRFEDEKGDWVNFTEKVPTNAEGVYKKHGEWAQPMFPTTRSIKGSPQTPYIFATQVSIDTAVEALAKVYSLGKEERMRRGTKGREFALKELSVDKMGVNLIKYVDECFEKWTPKSNFTVFNSDIKFDNYQRYPLKLKEETIKKVKELV
jgi:glycosyltransferase involved in cell wall biosynthesis